MKVILSLIALLCVVQWQVAALQTHRAVVKFHKGNKNITNHIFTSNETFFYVLCNQTDSNQVNGCEIHRISNVFGTHKEKFCDLEVTAQVGLLGLEVALVNESLIFFDQGDNRKLIALDIDSCNYQEHEVMNKDPSISKHFLENYGLNLEQMFSYDLVYQDTFCKDNVCSAISYNSKGQELYPPLHTLNPKFINRKLVFEPGFNSSKIGEINIGEAKIYLYNKTRELNLLKQVLKNEASYSISGLHDYITLITVRETPGVTFSQFKQNGKQIMEYNETEDILSYQGFINLPNGGFLSVSKLTNSANDIVYVRKVDANGHLNGNVTFQGFPTCNQFNFLVNKCSRIYESKDGEICFSNIFVNLKTDEDAFTITNNCFKESEIV